MIEYIRGSGGGCFPAGSKVRTPDGEVNIEDIRIGDTVLSFDYSGRIKPSKVIKTFIHEDKQVFEYYFWGGSLRATPNHWVLNQYNTFSEIGNLTLDDALVDINLHLRPIIKKIYLGDYTVYNLEVEDDHTYILEDIRVHNGGGGKGGGSAHVPVEDPDSLRSREYAKVIDLVSEGEIAGLVDGLKSVYLDDTPVQNADGTYNFVGVNFDWRYGTSNQSSITGFSGAASETSISTECRNAILRPACSFVGNLSGTTATVTDGSLLTTALAVGQTLTYGANSTTISSIISSTQYGLLSSALGTQTGVTVSAASRDSTFVASFNGNTMTVSSISVGCLSVGDFIFDSPATSVFGATTGIVKIVSQLSSTDTTNGRKGTYSIDKNVGTIGSTTLYGRQSGYIERSITATNLDAIRVTVNVPQLTYQDASTGDIHGSSIMLGIEMSSDGGATYKPQSLATQYSTKGTTKTGYTLYNGILQSQEPAAVDYDIVVNWQGPLAQVVQPYWNNWPPAYIVAGSNPQLTVLASVQYRLVGNTAWTPAATLTFSGKTTEVQVPKTAIGLYGQSTIVMNNYGGGFATQTSFVAPSGSQTVKLHLPAGQYEFQVVQIPLTSQPTVYGAIASIIQKVFGTGNIGTLSLGSNSVVYVPKYYDTITGKTITKYQRSYRIPLPNPSGTYLFRLIKYTADSTTSNLQNKLFWDTYTQVIDDRFQYPYSALMAIKIDSAQFSRIPTRAYEIYGIKVQIPSNYDPFSRTYNGIWDGTFVTGWTNNPAWVFYDLVTNKRYGLGDFLDTTKLDKWSLYSIGQYCDEPVPDGITTTGHEPRFTCNLYLQTREDAYKVLVNLASIFRAITYWTNNTLMLSQDAPSELTAIFSPANVIEGQFTYSGSSLKQRHTVVKVTWNDPQDNYKSKVEYVEAPVDLITRLGIIETEVAAMGCTSRGQAHRLGKAILYTEKYETETITFKTGLDASLIYPGAVIKTIDPFRTGSRTGGRIQSATTTIVTLDKAVPLVSTKNYKISCMLPDGVVEVRTAVIGTSGNYTNITVDTPFSSVPSGMWVIAEWVTYTANSLSVTDTLLDTWRVVSITEADTGIYEITAMEHHPSKYLEIEQDFQLHYAATTNILTNSALKPVINNTSSSFTGSITGNTLTVIALDAGTKPILANAFIFSSNTAAGTISSGTYIVSQISGTSGGIGTYLLSNSNTLASSTITTSAITDSLYLSGLNSIGVKIHLSWTGSASTYKVLYKRVTNLSSVTTNPTQQANNYASNWIEVITNSTAIDITENVYDNDLSNPNDFYAFKVIGINSLGMESPPSDMVTYQVIGKTANPTDVSSNSINASIQVNDYGVLLSWDPIPDLDVAYYEIREGTVWPGTGLIATNVTTTSYQIPFPTTGSHSYMVKAVDTTGHYSTNA